MYMYFEEIIPLLGRCFYSFDSMGELSKQWDVKKPFQKCMEMPIFS